MIHAKRSKHDERQLCFGYNNAMEKELKNRAKKKVLVEGLIILLSGTFVSMIFLFNKASAIVIFLVFVFISGLYVVRNLSLIQKTHLTHGKIIKVEKSNPDNSLVFQNYTIEYTDEETKERLETIVYEQFGDNEDEQEENIQEFFRQGQNNVGGRVSLLYVSGKPKKTFVYMD